ncbi:hypothetical protein [Actinomadura fulvescens]
MIELRRLGMPLREITQILGGNATTSNESYARSRSTSTR